MVSISAALARIKDNPQAVLDESLIEQVCRELGLEWRNTPLKPPNTIALFIRQVIEGNVSCATVRHLGKTDFTPGAYCMARARLPLEVLQEYSRRVCDTAQCNADDGTQGRYKGHRVWVIDGSNFSMPDTPELQKCFGQHKQQKIGCGFPSAHLLGLFNLSTGLLQEAIAAPLATHDLFNASKTHQHLEAGDLVSGDTAFGSYAHLALLLQRNLHGLFPVHQIRITSFAPGRKHLGPSGKSAQKGLPRSRWIKSLGKLDQRVEYFKPADRPNWMSQKDYDLLPDSIEVREIRRTIRRKGFRPLTVTLVTTLLDAELYPADELMALQARRWEVETDLRHLKTTMKMEVLHCQSQEGVRKELAVFVLVYNLVRTILLEGARRQAVPVQRLSFADALHWIRHSRPGDQLPKLLLNPLRPGRVEPRAVKRRPKAYDLLNKPRDQMRNALKSNRKGVN